MVRAKTVVATAASGVTIGQTAQKLLKIGHGGKTLQSLLSPWAPIGEAETTQKAGQNGTMIAVIAMKNNKPRKKSLLPPWCGLLQSVAFAALICIIVGTVLKWLRLLSCAKKQTITIDR